MPGAAVRPIIRRWPHPPQSDPPPRPAGRSDPAPSSSSLRNRGCVRPQVDGDDRRKIKEGGGTGGGVEEGRREAGKQEEVMEVEGRGEEGTGETEELRAARRKAKLLGNPALWRLQQRALPGFQ